MIKWTLDNSIFSFSIAEKSLGFCDRWIQVRLGKYYVEVSERTKIYYHKNGCNEILIIGICIDTSTEDKLGLCEKILNNAKSIEDVLEIEYYCGGKYIIFVKIGNDYYLLGDATCSLPVSYVFHQGCFFAASYENVLAKKLGLMPDRKLVEIRNSGSVSQAMPYDLTVYAEIKQLLPNHYIDLNRKKIIRFPLMSRKLELSAKDAAEITNTRILKLLTGYSSMYKLACPITSGRDSRVVLSYTYTQDNNVHCYTINHNEFKNNEQDIIIPTRLAETFDLNYNVLVDIEPEKELVAYVDSVFGKRQYSLRTLMIANTIFGSFGEFAIINGDIIGQIGKCSLHRDIPAVFATPRYFLCKLHNFNKRSKSLIKNWIEEVRASEEQTSLFDMFSIESRMGRWAAQEKNIYNAIGQIDLNIFNSRSILQAWCAVSRKERKDDKIHLALIENMNRELLDIPFEKETSLFANVSKRNGVLYLIGSYSKFYFELLKYKFGGKV